MPTDAALAAAADATATAANLGLDPAGYRDPTTGRTVPWGAPAEEIIPEDEQDDPGDGTYTVLDYLTDLAGAQGMPLAEWLGLAGDSQY